jgi:hypothetical protein
MEFARNSKTNNNTATTPSNNINLMKNESSNSLASSSEAISEAASTSDKPLPVPSTIPLNFPNINIASINTNLNSNNTIIDPTKESVEVLRSKFLDKVKLFMERYFSTKHFHLEDLSNNFIVPKNYFEYKMNHYPILQSPQKQKEMEFFEKFLFPNKKGVAKSTKLTAQQTKELHDSFNSPDHRKSANMKSSFHQPLHEETNNTNNSSMHSITQKPNKLLIDSFKLPGNTSTENLDSFSSTPVNNTNATHNNSVIAHNMSNLSLNEAALSSANITPKNRTERSSTLMSDITTMDETNWHAGLSRQPSSQQQQQQSGLRKRVLKPYACNIRVRGYGKPVKIDFRYLLNTKVRKTKRFLFNFLISNLFFLFV